MSFVQRRELCELKGKEIGSVHLSRSDTIKRLLSKPDEVDSIQQCILAVYSAVEKMDQVFSTMVQEDMEMRPQLGCLLEQYADVFAEPTGLPPKREVDHTNRLREGTESVRSCPYRYPTHQKDVIEQLVNEMLKYWSKSTEL